MQYSSTAAKALKCNVNLNPDPSIKMWLRLLSQHCGPTDYKVKIRCRVWLYIILTQHWTQITQVGKNANVYQMQITDTHTLIHKLDLGT